MNKLKNVGSETVYISLEKCKQLPVSINELALTLHILHLF